MKNLVKFLASGAIALAALAPAAAGASTLRVTFVVSGLGIDVSWLQDSNPTPINFFTGQTTLVSISGLQSSGATNISGWTDMSYYPASALGGLQTPGGTPLTNDAYFFNPSLVSQQYSGTEENPVFGAGNYSGTEGFSGDAATLTFTVVPPNGAPGPVPGAGLAGLVALALAGLYTRTRRA